MLRSKITPWQVGTLFRSQVTVNLRAANFTRGASTLLQKRHLHDLNRIPPAPQSSKNNFSLIALASAGLISSLAFVYAVKDYLGPRESKIEQAIIDLSKNPHHGYIVDSVDYVYIAPKPAGDLSGCIIQCKKTGKRFLKKGAKSKDSLIQEFLIATFLSKIRPGEQPSSFVMEEKHEDGTARLYTLSEIFPNSMDLAEFVVNHDFKAKLQKKPLVGFELALASDFMFAKQSDMKFSNLIVIETEEAYVIASIDHEMSGKGLRAHKIFTYNTERMILTLRDLNPTIEGEGAAVTLDPVLAGDFVWAAKPFIKPENIQAFYEKVAAVDMQEIINVVNAIEGDDGLINASAAHKYLKSMLDIQEDARLFLYDKQHENEQAASVVCRM